MARSVASDYARTYTTFSGCDIVCTFGNYVIGALQAITYQVQRETKFSVVTEMQLGHNLKTSNS